MLDLTTDSITQVNTPSNLAKLTSVLGIIDGQRPHYMKRRIQCREANPGDKIQSAYLVYNAAGSANPATSVMKRLMRRSMESMDGPPTP